MFLKKNKISLALSLSSVQFYAICLAPFLFIPQDSFSREVRFNPEFLAITDGESGKNIDLSFFSKKGGVFPGEYKVTVFVNDEKVDNTILNFIPVKLGATEVAPDVGKDQLLAWGINATQYTALNRIKLTSDLYPQLKGELDLNKMEYRITLPQIYLLQNNWLRTSPEQWQEGVPALMLNYNYSGNRQGVFSSVGDHYSSDFLNTDSLVNIYGWRLYNTNNWRNDNGKANFRSLRTWIQKSFGTGQGGELTLGETSSGGDLFDAFMFKGIKIESDDDMLQPMLTDYSPSVRGIAYSQARVTIKQDGEIIYEQNVPPGPFEFRELSVWNGGDLDITIREADGTERHYSQASANLPLLQREGRLKYSLSAGKYDGYYDNNNEPFFASVTAAWGLPNDYTIYGGGLFSSPYTALLLGVAKYNENLGAFSLDATWSDAELSTINDNKVKRNQGQSYRFSYARGFSTGTSINLSAYRYSTKNYYSFQDAMGYAQGNELTNERIRDRFVLSLSQSLDRYGQLSISGSQDHFWNNDTSGNNWNLIWNNNFKKFSLSLALGYSESPRYENDRTASLNLSIPLSSMLNSGLMNFNNSTYSRKGKVTNQYSVSGSTVDSHLNWSISNSWSNQGAGASQSGYMTLNGNAGYISGGYSRYADNDTLNYGVRGGMTVHSGGVTLSQPLQLNGGNVLINTNGVEDVPVKGSTRISTDRFGYTVLTGLPAFQKSNVSLDIDRFNNSTETTDTDKRVIPARGSLVPVNFNVLSGARAMVTLRHNGKLLPLGTVVRASSNDRSVTGIVGENGQVYLTGMSEMGTITAVKGSSGSCHAPYKFTNNGFHRVELQCQ
ncbi:fimbrial biogenesis outer membrane usher protein [Salmonella enterica]|nr:fimbrial biogenesis outer membrane usher protein [Salmonella enterica]